ncbi:MAG TPA: 3-hydroxyacyl-CoA dehydrogenase NAD-binding domain-containing protein [Verrucomicrobiae bacterium]|nr:3-hydroxyacyl-CoA dehydrogenase NAD-binding domain-containing protein [Verrucomicrobiae bacterium]
MEPKPNISPNHLERRQPATKTPPIAGASNLRREVNAEGICILTFDRPGSSANIFDRATLNELNEHLNFIVAHPELAGLVLCSAKKSIFIAGADLHSIAAETDPAKLRELIEFGQAVFNRIAALPMTTVAAIHGACVGGGFEISLACDWRVASADKSTRIGLPETQIGLIPAWGGSTRLPRLISLPKALDIILAGKTVAAKQALKYGMVDSLVPREYLLETALKKVHAGKPHRPRHALKNNALTASAVSAWLRPKLNKKTRGHYPAVQKALEVVTRGISRSVEISLRLEVDGIMELTRGQTTRNLIQLFFLQERAKKLSVAQAFQPAGSPDWKVRSSGKPAQHCAVVGAGVMGSGIAQWLSAKGCTVILRDIKPEFIARGMSNISRLYSEGVKRHAFIATEARAGLDRISPAAAEVPLHNIDFVIEAAVEDMTLKKEVFRKLEAAAGDETILATNTSALSVSELAASAAHPERIVGIHFFNPVHRMQLVEVVRAPATNPATVQRAIQFVQQLGKLPLLVNDSPGFLVNRILVPYLVEAGLLFEAGAGAKDIDEAMLDFGMPMGPLRLLDEVGLDVAHHISVTLSEKYPDRLHMPEILDKMLKAGFLGKKSGRGFYLHSKGGKTKLNSEVDAFRTSDSARTLTRHDLQERMVLLMINEAARCLEEGVVSSPEDVDFGMVMGTGFAPFRGGPLRYADSEGIEKIAAAMQRWTQAGVTYFEPCAFVKHMVVRKETFYGSSNFQKALAPETERGSAPPRAVPMPPPAPSRAEPAPSPTPRLPEPRSSHAEEAPELIDTSKMSAGQRAALELTEAARENATGSFASRMFMGRLDLSGISPFPAQSAQDREQGDAFLRQLETFLRERVDPDEIDRTGEIPRDVIEGLAGLGAFGIKISTTYSGLGLSQTNYSRAAMLLGSYCGNLTALLSAHQSIGVPQPLILFGTEEQKRKFLPRVAKGEISAFALTETGVGSDPANMQTHAEPTEDGKYFILNGEKLWCTNGTKAGVIIVMARTPAKVVNGKSKKQITAFIVEMDSPGIEVVHRCHFMGLKALYNGVIHFKNVRVPRENIVLAEGKGLRVALTTLNTGRLTLPAACVGLSKRCLEISKKWAAERSQWGAAIGKHAAIADKIAHMAANTFAMEAMTLLTSGLVTRDKHADIRLEAAMCKLWGSEIAWQIVNDTMQLRGGRGYETADSLRARGDEPVAVERFMRDCRINTIFEGSSEIMRLFVAREALDPHLKIAAAALDSRLPISKRLRAAFKAGCFYAGWYSRQWMPFNAVHVPGLDARLRKQMRYAARTSRKLARALFHAMVRFGPKLERQQVLLGRFVDIGAELFAITATCLRAQTLMREKGNSSEVRDVADYFCNSARLRVAHLFRDLHGNADSQGYRLAQTVLDGKQNWLNEGILGANEK